MEKPVTIKLAVIVFAGYLLTCSITTAKDVLNGRVVPPPVEQTNKAFTEEQWKIIYQLFQRYSSNVNIVNGEFEEWLRNVGAEIDTARDTAGAALAATWPWEDSSGRGPFWVDSSGYADTSGIALDADTSGSMLNAALVLRNNAVSRDSVWPYMKVEDDPDSIVITPEMIAMYRDAEYLYLSIDVYGDQSIEPSGAHTTLVGDLDVWGTLESDSADIDGGVDISTNLVVGEDVIVGENLNIVSTQADQFNIVHTPGADSCAFSVDATGDLVVEPTDDIWLYPNPTVYVSGDILGYKATTGAKLTLANNNTPSNSMYMWWDNANYRARIVADGQIVLNGGEAIGVDTVFILDNLSVAGTIEGLNNALDIGDAGGFSGVKFNPSTTRLEFWIDGSMVGYIGTDGAYVDNVP